MQKFATLDWFVIGFYFAILTGVAIWVITRKQKSTADYFLAGRNLGWFVVGASIFASNIGSEHVVGLAGSGAGGRFPLVIYELHAWLVITLGWVFLPFYLRSGVFTMPEFLERRFSPGTRWFLSVFSLLAYVLTKVSVTVYAGGIVISTLLGIDFWTGALITVILTGIYTILGGMRAVAYTEAIQTVILVIGAATLTFVGIHAAGGWSGVKASLPCNNEFHCGYVVLVHGSVYRSACAGGKKYSTRKERYYFRGLIKTFTRIPFFDSRCCCVCFKKPGPVGI